MKLKYLTNNPSQTKKLGEILAKEVLKTQPKKRLRPSRHPPKGPLALIFGLEGDLGGGKTTFLQGFARGLGIKEKILSPTFVIIKRFEIPKSRHLTSNIQYLIHIDCYRIEKPKEILDLGLKEIISNPKNIVAIEWSDRVRKILPKGTLILKFQVANKNKRKISFKYGS
ncbi:MAG: tRNA (adenosine(37)-N6)-threonylcarbamoyltransferase complex ATPase subunit type 1 TsaE [Candidatus Nealsonbacteria bacterium CG_4_8_14_3_um_filter_37_36]|uniref:tRNA threonylcarbamoyladenosine biosynthesis protein TsaE n=3 Tax=Candidatus Nealsoniibacteriota TaxID=1817911 RepID=A0A2M7ECB7_9BACT|nr:MAG: tRNA (adenosine(37)-N6)-threonylcarbamoyltransferase complex ATPase subunit type 1 TsaE [Candidatus Nealsonbacteria bacterium CG01_land_8_20_14_3_00_12]PIW91285.1 MAG: tRNA (adenosine(37)-N6)-threonylcarbamoyltransferase complex ATPase subunit type 1 TsaE [Candidatus Nealsonbacteria bacterium CG_4_8_14_3_um_filter_37_36]PJA83138.1 MAG: tRNA (adenosine(37)-N6)-threonylcarbamoyltransferase complex ATPase subunit type 1 TsaE [Candidatus Nealsonbacteria bacterium CG_4_9_14_3_um_filter_37_29]